MKHHESSSIWLRCLTNESTFWCPLDTLRKMAKVVWPYIHEIWFFQDIRLVMQQLGWRCWPRLDAPIYFKLHVGVMDGWMQSFFVDNQGIYVAYIGQWIRNIGDVGTSQVVFSISPTRYDEACRILQDLELIYRMIWWKYDLGSTICMAKFRPVWRWFWMQSLNLAPSTKVSRGICVMHLVVKRRSLFVLFFFGSSDLHLVDILHTVCHTRPVKKNTLLSVMFNGCITWIYWKLVWWDLESMIWIYPCEVNVDTTIILIWKLNTMLIWNRYFKMYELLDLHFELQRFWSAQHFCMLNLLSLDNFSSDGLRGLENRAAVVSTLTQEAISGRSRRDMCCYSYVPPNVLSIYDKISWIEIIRQITCNFSIISNYTLLYIIASVVHGHTSSVKLSWWHPLRRAWHFRRRSWALTPHQENRALRHRAVVGEGFMIKQYFGLIDKMGSERSQ